MFGPCLSVVAMSAKLQILGFAWFPLLLGEGLLIDDLETGGEEADEEDGREAGLVHGETGSH